jgi:hypothetical protein
MEKRIALKMWKSSIIDGALGWGIYINISSIKITLFF